MSDINQPFIRNIELTVGPLPEWKGGGNSKIGTKIFSDGSQDHLRVKFNIHKFIMSTATPTVISIYNLSKGLRNSLSKSAKEAQLSLKAGWQNTGMSEIFTGTLLASISRREGANIVTDLIGLAGYGGITRGTTMQTFSGGTSLKTLLMKLAENMPGVKVDSNLINIKDVNLSSGGESHAGNTAEFLDKLARTYGFNWWLSNGWFHAMGNGMNIEGGNILISYKNKFLIRAEPMLVPPFQMSAGVSIYSLLHPKADCGRIVDLESNLNPGLNGPYVIHGLTHSGDSHSTTWTTSIQSKTVATSQGKLS